SPAHGRVRTQPDSQVNPAGDPARGARRAPEHRFRCRRELPPRWFSDIVFEANGIQPTRIGGVPVVTHRSLPATLRPSPRGAPRPPNPAREVPRAPRHT